MASPASSTPFNTPGLHIPRKATTNPLVSLYFILIGKSMTHHNLWHMERKWIIRSTFDTLSLIHIFFDPLCPPLCVITRLEHYSYILNLGFTLDTSEK